MKAGRCREFGEFHRSRVGGAVSVFFEIVLRQFAPVRTRGLGGGGSSQPRKIFEYAIGFREHRVAQERMEVAVNSRRFQVPIHHQDALSRHGERPGRVGERHGAASPAFVRVESNDVSVAEHCLAVNCGPRFGRNGWLHDYERDGEGVPLTRISSPVTGRPIAPRLITNCSNFSSVALMPCCNSPGERTGGYAIATRGRRNSLTRLSSSGRYWLNEGSCSFQITNSAVFLCVFRSSPRVRKAFRSLRRSRVTGIAPGRLHVHTVSARGRREELLKPICRRAMRSRPTHPATRPSRAAERAPIPPR